MVLDPKSQLPAHTVADLDAVAGGGGVVWSASPTGLHVNLVVLEPNAAIPSHVNERLDVLLVVLSGSGTISLDGTEMPLIPHRGVQIPTGSPRSVEAGPAGIRYLTIHATPPPLDIDRTETRS
jgi:quercetin dioxygenase-like cupin family protein